MISESTFPNAFIIFIVGTSSVLPTLWGDFVFDDGEAIVKNSDVTTADWDWNKILKIFGHDFWGVDITHRLSHKSYRPLTTITYRVEYFLWSHNPMPFHLTDLILHGVNCVLVYIFLKKCLRSTSAKRNPSSDNRLAFWGSILFAVHPVHVEALGALVGRADLLAAFIFLGAYCVLLDDRSCTGTTIFSFAVILGSLFKETAISLSVFTIFMELVAVLNHPYPKNLKKIVGRHFLIISMAGGFVLWRLWLQDGPPVFQPYDNPPAFAKNKFVKISSILYIWLLNAFLLLNPIWLCYDWSMGCVPLIESFWDPRFQFVLIFLGICLRLIHLTVTNRVIRIAALIFTTTFLPSSNIMFTVGFVLAERNLYLPSIGFCLFIVYTFDRVNQKKCLLFVIVVFYMRSIQRSFEWRNEATLFKSALNVCPNNAKVHYNLGTLHGEFGNHDLAEKSYKTAISLRPDYYQAMNNLGNLLRVSGRLDEAEIWLRNAVEIKSDFAASWMNLGIILSNKNQTEALACYMNALKFRKSYPDCEYNLGNLFLDMGNKEGALRAWKRATHLKPKHSQAWINSVILLEQEGKLKEAKETASNALKVLKTDDALYFILGNILGKMSQFESAKVNFEKAINLRLEARKNIPPKYYSNLGVLYHRWGRKNEAVAAYEQALVIDPQMSSTRKNLEMLLKM